jgi:hypothetical protein
MSPPGNVATTPSENPLSPANADIGKVLAEKVVQRVLMHKLPALPGTMRRFHNSVQKRVAENIKLRNQNGDLLTNEDIIDGVRRGKAHDEIIQKFGFKNTQLHKLNQKEIEQ